MSSDQFCPPDLFSRPKSRVSATKDDFDHIKAREIAAAKSFEILNKDFRSMDCSVCDTPFGYQYRADPNVNICTPRCLTVARRKLLPNEESDAFLTPTGCSPFNGTPEPPELVSTRPASTSSNLHVELDLDEYMVAAGTSYTGISSVTRNDKPTAQFQELPKFIQAEQKSAQDQDTDQRTGSRLIKLESPPWLSKPCTSPTPTPENLIENFERIASEDAQPSSKIWTLDRLELSKSFLDGTKVAVLYAWDVVTYTLQAIADLSQIDHMQEDVAAYCKKTQPMTRLPKVGEIVFAMYPEDGAFYRGTVTIGLNHQGILAVDYIDFGSRSRLTLSQCWEPSEEIMERYPLYGLIFNLITPSATLPAIDDCDPIHRKCIEDELFTLKVKRDGNIPWSGHLIMEDGRDLSELILFSSQLEAILEDDPEDEVDAISAPEDKLVDKIHKIQYPFQKPLSTEIAKTAFQSGSAIQPNGYNFKDESNAHGVQSIGSTSPELANQFDVNDHATKNESTSKFHGHDINNEDTNAESNSLDNETNLNAHEIQQATDAVSNDQKLQPLTASAQVAQEANRRRRSRTIDGMALSPNFQDSATVSIAHFWNLGKVNLTAIADKEALEQLELNLLEYVTKSPPLNRRPQAGEIVLAPYADVYYRAKVMSVMEDRVNLLFIDFGDEALVDIKICREINDELLHTPVYGLTLKIEDVPQDLTITPAQEQIFDGLWELEVIKKNGFAAWRGQLWSKTNKKDSNYARIARKVVNWPIINLRESSN